MPDFPLSPVPSYYGTSSWKNYGQKRNGVHYVGDTVTVFHPRTVSDSDVKTFRFERGQPGARIGTTQYESDDAPFHDITPTGTGPFYSDAISYEGPQAAQFVTSGSMVWNVTETADHYGRAYVYFKDFYPGDSGAGGGGLGYGLVIFQNDSNPIFAVWIRPTGKLMIRDKDGRALTTTAVVPLNTWFRIEYHVVSSPTVGTMELRYFVDPSSLTPTETLSSPASWNTDTGTDKINFSGGVGQGGQVFMDDLVANADVWPGTASFELPPVTRNYEVRNYFGEVVSSGTFGESFCTPTPPDGGWLPGWYRIYFTGLGDDTLFGESCGVTSFCVIRDDPRFPPMPDPTVSGGSSGEAPDLVMKGVMGMGSSRLSVDHPDAPTTGQDTLAGAVANAAISRTYWSDPGAPYEDPSRPRPLWTNFPNGTTDSVLVSGLSSGTYGRFYCKDGTLDGSQVRVQISAGTLPNTDKVRVSFPNAGTLVETFDNLASGVAAMAAINGSSAYIRFYSQGASRAAVTAQTAIGNSFFNGVRDCVAALYAAGVTRFEGPYNEPTTNTVVQGQNIAHEMMLFQAAVHAGNPAALAIGPSTVNLYPQSLGRFWEAGGGDFCDEISIHAYNAATNGNLPLGRTNFQAFLDQLAAFGLDDKVLWQTESTQAITSAVGVYMPRRARHQLMYTMLMEQYGFPKELNPPWYDRSHGFWSFPAFLEMDDGSLNPQCVMARVLAEETWGKPFDHTLDFGVVGNSIYVGTVYTGDEGSTVALLATSYMTNGSVALNIAGTAGPVTVVDGFGNTESVSLAAGTVTVTMTDAPAYVELPPGCTVTVAGYNGSAADVVSIGPSATSKVIGGVTNDEISDDAYMTRYLGNYDSPGIVYSDLGPHLSPSGSATYLPDSAELKWDDPVTVGRLVVFAGMPWQYSTTLGNFTVETTDDGVTWTPQKTVAVDDMFSFNHGSAGTNAGCQFETYWSEQWVFDVSLDDPVTCLGVRVLADEASYGGFPDLQTITNYPDYVGAGSGAQRLVIQEISVFPDTTEAPVVSSDPVASGPRIVGLDVECTTGTWTNLPTSFAYQWQSSPDGGDDWDDIAGATSATYTIGSGLVGMWVRCVVTASNAAGDSSPAASNALGPIARPSSGGASPGGSMLPGGTTVYLPRKRARKTGFKRRRM